MSTQQSTLVFAPRHAGGARSAAPLRGASGAKSRADKSTRAARGSHPTRRAARSSQDSALRVSRATSQARNASANKDAAARRAAVRSQRAAQAAAPSKRERAAAVGSAAGAAVSQGARGAAQGVCQAVSSACSNWQRIAIGLVVLVIVVWAFAAPLRTYYCAVRDEQVYQAELAAVEQHNRELTDAVNSLQTREGIEDAARKRGYVGQGETAVTMEGVAPEQEVSGSKVKTTLPESPWYINMLDGLFGYKSPLGTND